MATYVDILKSEFPEIDSELFDYITGETPGPEPPRSRCLPARSGWYGPAFSLPVSRGPLLCSRRANELTRVRLTRAGTPGGTAWAG